MYQRKAKEHNGFQMEWSRNHHCQGETIEDCAGKIRAKFKDDPLCKVEGDVRHSSAGLLREFFKWSVKQNSEEMVKLIMKRLYSMWVHPKEALRNAASIAFNQIYVSFRSLKQAFFKHQF